MTNRRPLVLISGSAQELPTGDSVDPAALQSMGVYNGAVPAGSTTAVITHGLGTTNVDVTVRDSSGNEVQVPNQASGTNSVTLAFSTAPTAGQYTVRIEGAVTLGSYLSTASPGVFPMSHYGFAAASGDPIGYTVSSAINSGNVFVHRMFVPAGFQITGLAVFVITNGTYSTSSTPNQLGLWDDSGNLVASTANDNAMWSTVGWYSASLATPVAAQSADRWVNVGFIMGGYSSVSPAFAAVATGSELASYAVGPGQSQRRAWFSSGNTALPSSFTPGTTGTATRYQPLLAALGTRVTAPGTAASPVVTLTDAATIATDASQGNAFRVTLGGNRTLGNPTNMTDGQTAMWEIVQDATGSRTITLGSAFGLGTDISSVTLSTTAGKRDFLRATFNAATGKWYVLSFVRGY